MSASSGRTIARADLKSAYGQGCMAEEEMGVGFMPMHDIPSPSFASININVQDYLNELHGGEDAEKVKERKENAATQSLTGTGDGFTLLCSAEEYDVFDNPQNEMDPMISVMDEDVETGVCSEHCYSIEIQCISAFPCSFLIAGIAFDGSILDTLAAGLVGLFVVFFLQCFDCGAMRVVTGSVQSVVFFHSFGIQLRRDAPSLVLGFVFSAVAGAFSFTQDNTFCYPTIFVAGMVSLFPIHKIFSALFNISNKRTSHVAVKVVIGRVVSIFFLILGQVIGFNTMLFLYNLEDQAEYQVITKCSYHHDLSSNWYMQYLPQLFLFITVPLFTIFASLMQYLSWNNKQMVVKVFIACASVLLQLLATTFLGNNHLTYVAVSPFIGVLGYLMASSGAGSVSLAMSPSLFLLIFSCIGTLTFSLRLYGDMNSIIGTLAFSAKVSGLIISICSGVCAGFATIHFLHRTFFQKVKANKKSAR